MARLKLGSVVVAVWALAQVWVSGGPAERMPFSPPVPAFESRESFSFVVYGDIQDNHRKGHQALIEQMLKEPSIDLVLSTGDISPDHGRHYDRDFLPSIRKLAVVRPFFPSVGNHDILWKSPESRVNFLNFFENTFLYLGRLPDNAHLLAPANQRAWYALVHKSVLFVVLDSNLFIQEGKYLRTHSLPVYQDYLAEQLTWLETTLEKYAEDPGIRARFVVFHHSPFISRETVRPLNMGGHPGHSRMVINQELPSERSDGIRYLLDLFRFHGITAVFTGHEHYYERWQETVRADDQVTRQINWIVSGMGGVKPRGGAIYRDDGIAALVDKKKEFQEYLSRASLVDPEWTSELLHVYPNEGEPESRFHNYIKITVESDGVFLETKDIEGKVRDSGELHLAATAARSGSSRSVSPSR